MTKIIYEIRHNEYYDSVTLMLVSKEIEKMDGVDHALVGMGTDLNKELVQNLKMSNAEIEATTSQDFFVVVSAEGDVKIEDVSKAVDDYLNSSRGSDEEYLAPTIRSAIEHQPDSNIVLISVAGEYAADEARKALDNDLHVMMFSDNVSVEDEKELKEKAAEKGLLLMGPDCGTAIINNIPLAFANVVSKGNIGVVAASGTGAQEVTVIIDQQGGGVSQVLGTGGRDLSEEIGGIMMLQCIEALSQDENTEVLLLVSKPPAKTVADKIIDSLKTVNKPVVICFIGGNADHMVEDNIYAASSLEDGARKAVALAKGEEVKDFSGFSIDAQEIEKIIDQEVAKMSVNQKYFRGFFTGGTLASEAALITSSAVGDIYSNISKNPEFKLKNNYISQENTIIDFGEDEFTEGRPHPMIDPSARTERIEKEAEDGDVAVLLMDFVLGYGSNADPVGESLSAILKAKEAYEKQGKYLCVIGYLCGTNKDPQDLEKSKKQLEENGILTMPSNGQAALLAAKIMEKVKNR